MKIFCRPTKNRLVCGGLKGDNNFYKEIERFFCRFFCPSPGGGGVNIKNCRGAGNELVSTCILLVLGGGGEQCILKEIKNYRR